MASPKKDTKKYVIVNADGWELKNYQYMTWNSANPKKKVIHWPFSGKGVDLEKGILTKTLENALKKCAEHGYPNCKVVELTENQDIQQCEKKQESLEKHIGHSLKAPKTVKDAEQILKENQNSTYMLKEDLKEILPCCVVCAHGCKLSVTCTLYGQCSQFESIEKVA